MKLGEITKDSRIDIEVFKGDTSILLHATAIAMDDEALYVDPIRHNGNVISFSAPELSIEMTVVKPGEVPYYWQSVTVEKGKYEGYPCHIIRSGFNGVKLNRRASFRVYIGLDGVVTEVTTMAVRNVLIKDISSTGLGFLLQGEDEEAFKPNSVVNIHYTDGKARFVVRVEGKIIRREVTEAGILYGCRFTKVYPQIGRYIAQKQMVNRNKAIPLRGQGKKEDEREFVLE